jgi:hypothetical protein
MVNKFENGPYIEAALLCEKVLHEASGVNSIISIVDRVMRQATGPNPPVEMEPFDYSLFLYLRFKSGSARGPMPLQVLLVKPSGESPASPTNTVIFEGEDDRGIDIISEVKIKFDQVGVYWFYIKLDGTVVTKIPFRVIYIPQTIGTITGTDNRPRDQG